MYGVNKGTHPLDVCQYIPSITLKVTVTYLSGSLEHTECVSVLDRFSPRSRPRAQIYWELVLFNNENLCKKVICDVKRNFRSWVCR